MAKDKTLTLERLRSDKKLAGRLNLVADFDVTNPDPIDEVHTRDGRALQVIAGSASGDSYYLLGDGPDQPVLYVGGEGSCAVLGANLLETLQDLVQAPFWRDMRHTSPDRLAARAQDLDEEWREDVDKFAQNQSKLLRELGIERPDAVTAFQRMKSAAAQTAALGIHGGPDDRDFDLLLD